MIVLLGVFKMANSKNIAKQVLRGFGNFTKALGRGIQREFVAYQERERIRAIRRNQLNMIEEENRAAGRGYAKGIADVRAQERIRQQDERDYRAYRKRFNRMYEAPKVNSNLIYGGQPNRRKKKRLL